MRARRTPAPPGAGATARILLACLAVLALPNPVFALPHGGAYRGPNLPPPAPGTPGTGEANTGGPSTSGAGVKNSDPGAWSQWWALSRDMYMTGSTPATGAKVKTDPTSGETAVDSAPAEATPRAPGDRIPPEVLADLVVPSILVGLREKASVDLATASLIALAKIGPIQGNPKPPDLVAIISGFLDHRESEVAEAAVIALGVLGDRAAATPLTEILHGTRAGGALVGQRAVPKRTRAYAAYALAVIGSRTTREPVRAFVVHHLVAELQERRPVSRDVSIACVLGLGLAPLAEDGLPDASTDHSSGKSEAPPPAGSREGQCLFLLSMLEDRRFDEVVKSYVPVALARLVRGADPALKQLIAEPLAELARHQATVDDDLRAGTIQALGMIGDDDMDPQDVLIRERLLTLTGKGNRLQRNLAIAALGRIAGRVGDGERGDAPSLLRASLMKKAARGKSVEKPWAALAIGLMERGRMNAGKEPDLDTRRALRGAFSSEGNPSLSGALAVALGLCGDTESAPLLIERLTRGDETVRGHCATALGLMRAETAVEPLRALAWGGVPGIAREAAIALDLCGDREAWAPSGASRSDTRVGVVGLVSLAYVGGESAIAPLLETLIERDSSDIVRAYAVVALGIICDKDPTPWNHPLAQDACWWSAPLTLLDSKKGLGVVDLF